MIADVLFYFPVAPTKHQSFIFVCACIDAPQGPPPLFSVFGIAVE